MGRNKGLNKNDQRIWGRICQYHHLLKLRSKNKDRDRKYLIPNDKCDICGWDKAYCDRHRIVPEIGYTRNNIKILCPNCHRLETIKQRLATRKLSSDLITGKNPF